MEKTRKWRKILAMMLTVVMMLQNAQSVMVFADVTNEQIEQRLAGNQEQTEETQPAQSQVDTRANGEEYKTQSQETQENGNGSTDIGSPESGNATTEAKTSNADVSATITQSVFQADVSGTTCNFVQMTAQITNNDAENPATGVSVKSLLNSSQLNYVNGYGAETSGAGAYYIDSNNTSDLPDGSTNGYDQIVMWTDQTIGAGETAEYQFAAQIIPADLTGVVDAWYVDGTSCSYTWQNTEILVPTQAPEETTPEATPEVTPETTPEVTETPEETPTPEVTETPEVSTTPAADDSTADSDPADSKADNKDDAPEVTETPDTTEIPEITEKPEDNKDNIFDRKDDAEDKRPQNAATDLTDAEKAATAVQNHTCDGITVSGIDLPWYVQFRVSGGDDYQFTNEEDAAIFKSYEFELWDTQKNTEYKIPDGEYISVTVPVKAGYTYSIEHLLDNGAMETIIPSVDGDTMTFSTHSFSPFGIAGSKSLVGPDAGSDSSVTVTPAADTSSTDTGAGSSTDTSNDSGESTDEMDTSKDLSSGTAELTDSSSQNGTESSESEDQSSQAKSKKQVNTGDTTQILPFVILFVAAAVVAGVAVFLKKRKI